MSYETTFSGQFKVVPPLMEEHRRYLLAFSETRRVRRDAAFTARRPDAVREAAGLPVGDEGGFFVGAGGMLGQEGGGMMFDPGGPPAAALGILDFNRPPQGQPHLWCCWQPTKDGGGLHIPEAGSHYDPLTWLNYLQKHFLGPWGYGLEGEIAYRGADALDSGRMVANGKVVMVYPDHQRVPLSEGWSARERGEAAFARKDWNAALAEFEVLAMRAPQWPDSWWMKGMTLGQLGRFDDCIACLDRALIGENDSQRREARRTRVHALLRGMGKDGLERARTHRSASRFAEAVFEYQAFLAALPADQRNGEDAISATIGKGLSHQGAGQIDEAFAAYYHVTQIAPGEPTGWTYAGYLMAYQYKKPEEAIPFFELAIQAGNEGSDIFNELGMAHGRCGHHAEARDAFIQATHADPDDPLPWFNLGHAFLALKNPAEAAECFQRAAGFEDPRCHAAAMAGLAEARRALSR